MDYRFCPGCQGLIEAGGDNYCICDELADHRSDYDETNTGSTESSQPDLFR